MEILFGPKKISNGCPRLLSGDQVQDVPMPEEETQESQQQ